MRLTSLFLTALLALATLPSPALTAEECREALRLEIGIPQRATIVFRDAQGESITIRGSVSMLRPQFLDMEIDEADRPGLRAWSATRVKQPIEATITLGNGRSVRLTLPFQSVMDGSGISMSLPDPAQEVRLVLRDDEGEAIEVRGELRRRDHRLDISVRPEDQPALKAWTAPRNGERIEVVLLLEDGRRFVSSPMLFGPMEKNISLGVPEGF